MCWLFHKWGKWERLEDRVVPITINGLDYDYNWINTRNLHERTCQKCGKVQINRSEV